MWNIFNKTSVNAPESLIKRVIAQELELSLIKAQILSLEMEHKAMRDKVLRKIQGKKEVEEEPKTETDLNKTVLIPSPW